MELTLDQALQKGIEVHKAGQVQEADRLYTAILQSQPEHPDANHNMGVLAVGVGKVQEALPFFKTALEANPSTAQFWLSYIDALIRLERIPDAKAVLDQAKSKGAKGDGFDELEQRLEGVARSETTVSQNQDPPQDQLEHLINLYNQGHHQEVIDQASQLLQHFPNSVTLYNIQGAANTGFGQLDAAIDSYNKALALKPDYAEAYNNMGNAIKEQGKLDKAIEAYNKALTLKPDYAEAYNNMGGALKEQGKLEEAIEAYKKALAIKPDYAEAYYNMGNAFLKKSKLEEAIEVYNKALAIKPYNAEAHNYMGIALQEQGKLEEAIVAYNKALVLKPDYAEAYYNMGNASQKQGKLEEAIEAYNKALVLTPDYAEAYYNMGNASLKQGKLDTAIEAYNKALSIKSDYAEAYNNIGATLQKQGKPEEAIEAYNKALTLKPDYADVYCNMGGALKEQGKLDEAMEAFKKALALKPDYGNAKHMLSSLTGKTTNSAPREYVENLFDEYASKFDQSLVEKLEYNIPKILTNLMAKEHGSGSLGSVLDLGCGTGLTGVEIKEFCSKLEGIDLSNRMLEQASVKGVYNKLSHVDIVEYLSRAELNFDYFISTDVFVYVGELSGVFRLIKSRNKKPGKLVFSTEHTEKEGFHLEKSGRYSHSKSYIDSLCEKFSYSISHFSTTNLRKEKNKFLTGGVYLLNF